CAVPRWRALARVSYPVSTSIVGRESELEEIRQLLRRVELGRTQLLLLTGDSGVGKSTLALAAMQPMTVVRFYHRESDSKVPLSAVRQVIETYSTMPAETAPLEVAAALAGLLEEAPRGTVVLLENIDLMDQVSKEVIWHVAQRIDDA